MMRDNRHLPSNDSLDQAIHRALKVEASQEQIDRLEHYWTIQSRRQRRRRLVLRVIPVAAAMLAIVAAYSFSSKQPELRESTDIRIDSAPIVEERRLVQPLVVDKVQRTVHSFPASRTPTAFERLVFSAKMNVRMPAAKDVDGRVGHAINQVTIDSSADAEQALSSTGLEPADAEAALLAKLGSASTSEQVAISRLLEVCGTQRSVPALLRFAERHNHRDQALTAIEQVVGLDNLAQVVGSTSDSEVRRGLMLRMLSSNSDAALRGYLSLVGPEATRREALAVAEGAAELPAAALVALLDDESREMRFYAALVLGHANGPEVTRLLIARVTAKPSNSAEAWVALVACRGERAEQFLAYATREPKLLGHCNYARIQWAQVIH